MLQEPSDKLVCIKGYLSDDPGIFIVLIIKADLAVFMLNNPVIRDGYTVGVVP